jgi:hypothetical protein
MIRNNPTGRQRRLQVEALEDRNLLSGAGLTVMSDSLFQGRELTQALTAPSLAQLPAGVSSIRTRRPAGWKHKPPGRASRTASGDHREQG